MKSKICKCCGTGRVFLLDDDYCQHCKADMLSEYFKAIKPKINKGLKLDISEDYSFAYNFVTDGGVRRNIRSAI